MISDSNGFLYWNEFEFNKYRNAPLKLILEFHIQMWFSLHTEESHEFEQNYLYVVLRQYYKVYSYKIRRLWRTILIKSKSGIITKLDCTISLIGSVAIL